MIALISQAKIYLRYLTSLHCYRYRKKTIREKRHYKNYVETHLIIVVLGPYECNRIT